jgi:hypothetical protein
MAPKMTQPKKGAIKYLTDIQLTETLPPARWLTRNHNHNYPMARSFTPDHLQ